MISSEEIRRIAALAHLELTEEEVTKFSRELSEILDFFAALEEVDTTNVVPTAQITGLMNIMGQDTVQSCAFAKELLNAAPNPIKRDHLEVHAVFNETPGDL